ncbi:hypothetical protein KFE25_002534 [Diacronema lutheri]|uniref:DUF1754-domain-containing protein n=2 Tax=Diacronema lutheri TaxID=2081491 RepID=A0A8J6C1T3_DIALT|nr:hypothetical protein KFE25_002534 [Diacronema lutheri]
MSDAYSNVVGGSLKLKGKRGKTKKRTHTEAEVVVAQDTEAAPEAAAMATTAASEAGASALPEDKAGLTKAQLDYVRAHERNMRRKGDEQKAKTYRDRIAGLNEYLSNLSEHHDVPRVTKH